MSALILAGAALAYSGFAAKSLTLDRHYADLHGRGKEPSARLCLQLRTLGWLALALSFAACIRASGWHIGPVLWCGVLSIAAWCVALLLQYAPRHAIQAAWIGAPAAIVVAVMMLGGG